MAYKILMSGGNGLLASEIVKQNNVHRIVSLGKEDMDVSCADEINKQIDIHEPDIFIHCGALTHPMEYHESNPTKSIKSNIIGTSNVACSCAEKNIKMVYISTEWVYPPNPNNTENCALKPFSNYGWSKLGGECAVQMIPNHLILRCSFTQKPYKHDSAFEDVYKSYLYVDEACKIILKMLEKNHSGVYNVGGKTMTVYDFAKKSKPDIKKISKKGKWDWIPTECTLSVEKIKQIVDEE